VTFFQAIVYFLREAGVSLVRSWKISLLAVTTIAVSLFLAGVFLLVSGNLRQLAQTWQSESKIVVYLEPGVAASDAERLRQRLADAPWALEVVTVTADAARERFSRAFPSLSDLLEGWDQDPLPPSLEVRVDWTEVGGREALEAWLAELRRDGAVSMVDDDRDWLSQLQAVVFALEALGLVLGAILLGTAIFTISSVIRLTAYLYRDEIGVMRLVGATEFFIRGPFYVEGLLQGLAGGVAAVLALAGAHALLMARYSGASLSLLAAEFLAPGELLALVGLGGLAGLVGAIASLRREALGRTAETPEWEEE
jgi:cell division transport system permease protein